MVARIAGCLYPSGMTDGDREEVSRFIIGLLTSRLGDGGIRIRALIGDTSTSHNNELAARRVHRWCFEGLRRAGAGDPADSDQRQ